MKKGVLIASIVLMLSATFFIGCFGEESESKYSIQQLINNASFGDVINIPSGTYYENIIINKGISLIGENKETTIINGKGNDTLLIKADNVVLSGFTITNGGHNYFNWSLKVTSKLNLIYDNIIEDSLYGLDIENDLIEPEFWDGQNITIRNNIFRDNYFGILAESAHYNYIHNNTFENNQGGIRLYMDSSNDFTIGCFHNEVVDNFFSNNDLDGIAVHKSSYNLIKDNIFFSNGQRGIYLTDSDYNDIIGNHVERNDEGISVKGHGNIVSNNIVKGNNRDGIEISHEAFNNTVKNNNILDNNQSGINILTYAENTKIYQNNLINNLKVPSDSGVDTVWYNEQLKKGNYWDSYNGNDTDGDGIGDIPYKIPYHLDRWDLYPLMSPVDI